MAKKPQQQLAKLSRPRLHKAVARERLFAKLDKARERQPAICVVGPPGAGKTTLVASWLDARSIKGIWYQVDAGDADLATFFYYLGQAAQPFTRKRQRPLPLLTPEYLHDVEGFSRRYFRQLFGRLPEGATLVLDNYQEVPAEQRFHELVAAAVTEVPLGITVICVSRHDPPDCYARLVANENVGFVEWEALKLTVEEAEAIGVAKVSGAAEEIVRLHHLSEGWTAGFILLLERLQQGDGADSVDRIHSLRAVFDYFAGQLFERATRDTQRLLLRLSFLPRMGTTAVERLAGSEDAIRLLEDLHRRHLFIDQCQTPEPVYQFHALLHTFLHHRATETLTLIERRELLQQAARVLEQTGEPEEALALYFKAGKLDAVHALIRRQAARVIGQGRWKVVVEWIEKLPHDRVEADCWLMNWLGTAKITVEPSRAREALEKSFELAQRKGDERCQVQAAAGLIGTYMAEYTHFRPLDRWIAVLEEKLSPHFDFGDPEFELRIQSAMVIALAFRQPSNTRLASCVERVFELLQTSSDINASVSAATHLLRYGATTGPIEVARRALVQIEGMLKQPEVTPVNAALGLAAMTWYHCLTRNPRACRAACDEVERIAEDQGLPFLAKPALTNRMWLALFGFNASEGRELLERLEQSVSRSHPFDLAILHGARSWIAICENKPDVALGHALRVVSFLDEAGSVMHIINYRFEVVVALFLQREFDSARRWIEQTREIAKDGLTDWQQCSFLMWEANIALATGNRAVMLERLRNALVVAQQERNDFGFSNWCRPWMPRLCQEALSSDIEVRYVRELIRRYDLPPPSPHAVLWPWPIKIYALGEFRILRHDEAMQFGRKAPRRVLAVLKYIVAHGGNGVPLRQLADSLWPDEEGDAALQALGVALVRLRKLLGGHDFLCVNDERVSINRELVWLDARVFEDLVTEMDLVSFGSNAKVLADTAARLLLLYRGDLLPADCDEPWGLRPRLRLRTRFIRCLISLGASLEACGRWDLAVDCYRRGLEADDLAEEFYQGLMRCYDALAQPAQGIAVFERLRQTLSATFGVVPSPASEGLAHKLQEQYRT